MANPGSQISDIVKCYPRIEQMNDEGKAIEIISNKHYVMNFRPSQDNIKASDTEDPYKFVIKKSINNIDDYANYFISLEEEAKWRKWIDDHFVHIISPNVYRTYKESYQAFDHHVKMGKYNETWEGWVAKVGGSTVMWLISKKLKKKYLNLFSNYYCCLFLSFIS